MSAAADALSFPWAAPPAAGEARPVIEGLDWVRMPLPFQLNHVNCWRFDDGDSSVVFDCGLGMPQTRDDWRAALNGRAVGRVIVSHFHPDHIGAAGWFVRRFGARIEMTEREFLWAAYAWSAPQEQDIAMRMAHYRQHGLEEGEADAMAAPRFYPRGVPTLPESFRRIEDRDAVMIGGRRWRAMTVFGHAPEMIALYAPDLDIFIAADEVLPTITPNVSVNASEPDADPLGAFFGSLDRIASEVPDSVLVLPSHGLPFRGLHARIGQIKRHHEERLAIIRDACREPLAASEVLPLLFRRKLDGFQFSFALGETLAHLNRLWVSGELDRLPFERDGGPVLRFRTVR